jgi:uncharacterized membrane protein YbhN (UPF0104 family)
MSRIVLVRQRTPDVVVAPMDGSLGARPPVRWWAAAALLGAASLGVIAGARLADLDVADDLWDRAGSFSYAVSQGAERVRWGFVPVLAALTALHYLASSLGVRAAADGVAGRRLGVWDITTSQFAGAAANRLAPGGLGSAAVTCRYLTRRGLACCEATAAVAVVGIVRGITRLALVALTVAVWSGTSPAGLPTVDLARMLPSAGTLVPVSAGAGGVVVVLVACVSYRRRARGRRLRAAVTGVARSLRQMLRRPRCLVASLAAATGANIALALAFAVSVVAIPDAGGPSVGALLGVYVLGATVGAAIPTPAGVGSTEAALVTVLAAVHVPAAAAAQAVLLFRVMTFWAPIPAGVASTRRLRRLGGL